MTREGSSAPQRREDARIGRRHLSMGGVAVDAPPWAKVAIIMIRTLRLPTVGVAPKAPIAAAAIVATIMAMAAEGLAVPWYAMTIIRHHQTAPGATIVPRLIHIWSTMAKGLDIAIIRDHQVAQGATTVPRHIGTTIAGGLDMTIIRHHQAAPGATAAPLHIWNTMPVGLDVRRCPNQGWDDAMTIVAKRRKIIIECHRRARAKGPLPHPVIIIWNTTPEAPL